MSEAFALPNVIDRSYSNSQPLYVRPRTPLNLSVSDLTRLYFSIESARTGKASLIVQFAGVDGKEGVSTIAAGYAGEAAREPGCSVLLIRCGLDEADAMANRPPALTLLELLRAGRPIDDGTTAAGARTAFAPRDGGSLSVAMLGTDPERIANPRMLQALGEALRQRFGLIVLDCGPVGASPLASALARIADGSIVVAQAGRTKRRSIETAAAEIGRGGGQVLGLVLNRQREWLPAWLRRRVA